MQVETPPVELVQLVETYKRSVAWVLTFVANCRSHRQERRKGSLSPEELQNAEIRIIRDAQQEEISEEYRALQENKPVLKKSSLIKL